MSPYSEKLISKGVLSVDAGTLASKGLLDSEANNIPIPPSPHKPVSSGYSGKGGKMSLGYIVYGVRSPVIKIATEIDGVTYKTTVIKDSSLQVRSETPDILVSRPNIQVEVSNINV